MSLNQRRSPRMTVTPAAAALIVLVLVFLWLVRAVLRS